MHDEFLCHVTAYGVCGGRRIGVPLGTYRAPTLALALWWLRDRASWIAQRLDPRPDAEHFLRMRSSRSRTMCPTCRPCCAHGAAMTINKSWSPMSWRPDDWCGSP